MSCVPEKFYEEPETFPKWIVWWAVALVVILLLMLWWCWPAITGTVIVNDLRGYATEIRESELPVESKVELLNQIDNLENELNDGCPIGLLRWRSTNAAIQDFLKGDITADEVRLIQRELSQLEKQIK
jgi:hypothetical protein